jgi:hypothetical protein
MASKSNVEFPTSFLKKHYVKHKVVHDMAPEN